MIGLVAYRWQTDFDDDGQIVGGGHWRAPGEPTGTLDLASLGQIMAARPGVSRPVCLATYDAWPDDADCELLSAEDPRDARPDERMLNTQSTTGFRPQGESIDLHAVVRSRGRFAGHAPSG